MNRLESNDYWLHLFLYNKDICTILRDGCFSMDFRVKNVMNLWSDYLAIPNNLLLSHRRTVAYTSQKHIFARTSGIMRLPDRKKDSKKSLSRNCRVRWPKSLGRLRTQLTI